MDLWKLREKSGILHFNTAFPETACVQRDLEGSSGSAKVRKAWKNQNKSHPSPKSSSNASCSICKLVHPRLSQINQNSPEQEEHPDDDQDNS